MFENVWRGRPSFTLIGALALVVALTGVVAGGAQAAKPGNSENAKACQKGGWQTLVRSDGSTFTNQGECVSYAAKGGTLALTPLALCKQQLNEAGLSAPSNANYILGTSGNDNFGSQITAEVDVICGFGGNDFLLDVVGGDIFLGGDGDDWVSQVVAGTFHGGEGNDFVVDGVYHGGTFIGGDGCDSGFSFGGSVDLGDQACQSS